MIVRLRVQEHENKDELFEAGTCSVQHPAQAGSDQDIGGRG